MYAYVHLWLSPYLQWVCILEVVISFEGVYNRMQGLPIIASTKPKSAQSEGGTGQEEFLPAEGRRSQSYFQGNGLPK